MTEVEWLICDNVKSMLRVLRGRADERKLRLFAVAGCRSVWSLVQGMDGQRALETAEGYADGAVTQHEMITAYVSTNTLINVIRSQSRNVHQDPKAFALLAVLRGTSTGLCFYGRDWEYETYDPYQCASDVAEYVEKGSAWGKKGDTLRDIFGNPFRPVAFDTAWRTDTAVALATQMYESRDFGAMPILADALQDAGCDSDDILSHCRGPGPHVRGCWVVDLVLGK